MQKQVHYYAGSDPKPLSQAENTSKLVVRYLYQILHGCGSPSCTQLTCRSAKKSSAVFPNQTFTPFAALNLAIHLTSLRGCNALCMLLREPILPPAVAALLCEEEPLRSKVFLKAFQRSERRRKKKEPGAKDPKLLRQPLSRYTKKTSSSLDAIPEEHSAEHTKRAPIKKKHSSSVSAASLEIPTPVFGYKFNLSDPIPIPWIPKKERQGRALKAHYLDFGLITKRVPRNGTLDLTSVDPTGEKTATTLITIFTCRYLWDDSVANIGLRRCILGECFFPSLDKLVEWAMNNLDKNKQLFFVRTVSDALVVLPVLRPLVIQQIRSFELNNAGRELISYLTRIVELAHPSNVQYINVPIAFSAFNGLHFSKPYSIACSKKAFQTWRSFSSSSSSPYIDHMYKSMHCNALPFSRFMPDLKLPETKIGPYPLLDFVPDSPRVIIKGLLTGKKRPLLIKYPSDPVRSNYLSTSLHMISDYPKFIPFETRYKIFRYKMFEMMEMSKTCSRAVKSVIFKTFNSELNVWMLSFFKITVFREYLIESAFLNLSDYFLFGVPRTFNLPFRVKYGNTGEIAVDEGGVQVEFFQSFGAEVMKKEGFFLETDDESTVAWFPKVLIRNLTEYLFLGIFLGIAIYNGCTVSISLPLFFYKHLKMCVHGDTEFNSYTFTETMDYLKEIYPSVGKSFQMMNDDPSTIDEMEIPLNDTHNNTEYVTSKNYRKFISNWVQERIKKKCHLIKTIADGIFLVVEESHLTGFSALELRQLIEGNHVVTAADLEANVAYGGNFTPNSPTVILFWKIVKTRFSNDDTANLFEFVTGSNRVPPSRKFDFIIQSSTSAPNLIPTASVCFSILNLSEEYKSIGHLETMIRLAIENSKGFGLV